MRSVALFFGFILSTNVYAMSATQKLEIESKLRSVFLSHGFVLNKKASVAASARPTPIRQAKLRVKIYKGVAQKNPDGSFSFQENPVCTGSVAVNVYDSRNGGANIDQKDMTLVTCTSTYQGQPLTVNFGGSLALATRELLDSTSADYKASGPFLWFENQSGNFPKLLSGYMGSADLDNSNSMLTFMQPESLITCTAPDSCQPTYDEYFTATVEIRD